MATIVNARDVILQAAAPRLVSAPTSPVQWLDITGPGKPADNADITNTALQAGQFISGGGLTLTSGGSIKGGQSDFAVGSGWFLGYSGGQYKFSIGNASNFVRWTGTALEITGTLTGNSSINIWGTAKFGGAMQSLWPGETVALWANYAHGAIHGILGNSKGPGHAVVGICDQEYEGQSIGSGLKGFANGAGTGVWGQSTTGIGGHFQADSTSPALRAIAYSSGGIAGLFSNQPGTKAVALCTSAYAAYSDTGFGKQYFMDGAGPFTGFHPVIIPADFQCELGDIIVDKDILYKTDVSNTIGTGMLSSKPCERGVVGVVSEIKDLTVEVDYETWWQLADYDNRLKLADVNGLGEGLINVCGEGGDIKRGDLIVTSSRPGKGMKQDTEVLMNYTVAKAREDYTFEGDEVFQLACFYVAS